MPKTILYIHQSAELYGSDKALSYLVKEIDKNPNFTTIVILPEEGPLKELLERAEIRVIVFPVIKVSRSIFKLKSLISLPFVIARTTKKLRKLLEDEKIDIVHSNTLAVLLGAFFARRYRIKHIWHIHEIIKKPKIVRTAYPILVRRLSSKAVYNSKASRDFLCAKNTSLFKKSIINLNGMDRLTPIASKKEISLIRSNLFEASENDIIIALIGRISKWKGQQLLLEAFADLNKRHKNLKLIFVGSAPPNQEVLVDELNMKISEFRLHNHCKIIPFQENIWSIWDSIDIAVVPSTEPEPFGLVALEAMLSKKPVVAANHGGLIEIIKEGKTGYFFKPNNSDDLDRSIEKLILSKDKLVDFGINGYERAIESFSLRRHIQQFVEIYQDI